jgi:hypothetical protein
MGPPHYLPRLAGPEVLAQTIRDGLSLLTWRADTFGYAESYDEAAARYRGLQGGHAVNVSPDSRGLLVKAEVASSNWRPRCHLLRSLVPRQAPVTGQLALFPVVAKHQLHRQSPSNPEGFMGQCVWIRRV